MRTVFILLIFTMMAMPAASMADTIFFSNGGSVEGIIKDEDAGNVNIDIGFGTITCARGEIKSITRSTPDEIRALTEKWEKKRQELKSGEATFELERKRNFEEYERWTKEERERQEREQIAAGTISLMRDPETKSILVEATVNERVKATLVLDTGASIVVLTRRIGEELGIDLSDTRNNIVTLQLAGEHKVGAKLVMLKSVRINDIEVKDVMAGILLEDGGMGLKDGLLGMTFLNRFNLKIDLKNMRLSLEKAT